MLLNIILISLIIIILFFMSNDEKINNISTKKNIKILFLLIIIYFVYQNYNIFLLFILFIIFIAFTIDIKNITSDFDFSKIFKADFDNIIPQASGVSRKLHGSSGIDGSNKKIFLDFFKNYSSFKNTIFNYFKNQGDKEHFTFKPYTSPKDNQKNNLQSFSSKDILNPELFIDSKQNDIQPFKEDVQKIKAMYENIKMEINKLNK